ncbi:MAG: threonylcarbamoyl-AMP synthase [Paludibacteraceae bacterium]|nr:threonylcarbamoyl-AMP synthase [Paludibacteraceae bacterium]
MKEDIKNAIKTMKNGGIILYPTDTIWGLGCDATNEEAVKKIFEIKKREDSKSMLVLTDSAGKVERLVGDVPKIVWDLVEVSDKPLTIIYPGGKNMAKNLIAQDGSVGIRITNETFSKELCAQFRLPIVSTSANISGEPSPSNFSEISEEIIKSVDYVVQYRQNDKTKAKPSSIIKVNSDGTIKIIRE